jgi:asparagine synthase (glutamine-hydrolysing)
MEDTYYASVKRVPPGHALRVDRTARKVIRHWDPGPPEEPIRWISEDDVEQFEGLLDQAVERCLAWGPTAMYLSGGLDSATVVAVAADRAAQDGLPPPLALSLIFPDPDCNEEVIQRGVAQVLGLPQVLAPFDEAVGPAGLIPAALEISRTWPFPLFNVWFPAYRHLALEAKRQGRRSILTGSGGDEWLTISPFLAADLVRGADVRGFYALWQNLRRSYPVGGARLAHHLLWRYGVRPLLLERFGALSLREGLAGLLPLAWGSGGAAWPARGPSMPAWLAPDAALREDVRSQVLAHLAAQRRVQGFYLRDGRRLLDQPVLAEFKEDTFEAGRRSGILQLHPFWDADLVDFLYRIPPKLLVRQGTSKGLVRGMLASRFPELGFARQRKGTAERFAASLSLKDGARAWDRLGGAPALADLGIVEPRALGRAMDETLAHHRFRNAHLVWDVLHLEAWLQAHQSSKGS